MVDEVPGTRKIPTALLRSCAVPSGSSQMRVSRVWGGTRLSDSSHPGAVASGQWSAKEIESRNINVLELKGALFTLKSLCTDVSNKTIDLKVDNMTAVAAVRKMGSKP